MKTLRNIFAVVLFTSLIASCNPTEVTEGDIPDSIEQARVGGDDTAEIDNDRD